MNKKLRKAALTSLLMLGLSQPSCRHAVIYKISQEGRALKQHFPVNLQVAEFEDKAPKYKSVKIVNDGSPWKTNALEVYKKKEYAEGISQMVAKDLESTGMFAKITPPNAPGAGAEFVLRATIWDFSAVGKWQTIPENAVVISCVIGNIPGLLMAAAATSWVKTDVVSSVILTDIRILDLSTGNTVWTCPPLRAGTAKKVRWSQADPSGLVKTANEDLREVVTKLIQELNARPPSALH